MNEKCAIVIMSCDAYHDLWNDFFDLKEKYWRDCPYKTYLVSNNMPANREGVTTILCGDELNWTGRLIKCLNAIDEDRVILMLEDYYISSHVDNVLVDYALETMNQSKAVYYKLETRGTIFDTNYDGVEYLKKITPNIRYGVSLITSIWDKRFLLEVIGDEDYPAWEFELRRNREDDFVKKTDKLLLCDTRNILNITHMVQRGQYLRSSLRKLEQQGDTIVPSSRGKVGILFEFYTNAVCMLKRNDLIRQCVLKFVHVFGFKSISEKYSDEIKKGVYK